MCVCVLTGLRRWAVWQNHEVVEFQDSVSDCLNPRLCCLLLCIFRCPYYYSNPRRSYHTSSSAQLRVPCLRRSISVCHTSLFPHLGVSCFCPSMLTTHLVLPLPSGSGSYCIPILPLILVVPLASRKSTRVDQSYFSVASWRHHSSLLRPPPSYLVYLADTSNKERKATHCATFSWCRSM